MIPEELMEELYTLIYHTDLDGFERIERAITRIGKAYADGEMKMPGEAGRGRALFGRAGTIQNGWIEEPLQGPANYQEFNIIAFHKEEGQ